MATKLPPSELESRPLQFVRPCKGAQVIAFDASALTTYYEILKRRTALAEASAEREADTKKAEIYAGIASAFHDATMLFLDLCAYRGVPSEDARVTAPLRPVLPLSDPELEQELAASMRQVEAVLNGEPDPS